MARFPGRRNREAPVTARTPPRRPVRADTYPAPGILYAFAQRTGQPPCSSKGDEVVARNVVVVVQASNNDRGAVARAFRWVAGRFGTETGDLPETPSLERRIVAASGIDLRALAAEKAERTQLRVYDHLPPAAARRRA
jgi:hypothetical protein